MDLHQSELLELLRRRKPTAAAKALLKRTFEEFVLEYGWWYEPTEIPESFSYGPLQQCHKNAADLATASETYIYCEGFALLRSGMMPTLHAWVTDGHGQAIDNTWKESGVAYAGVPFKTSFVAMTALVNHATISLLDDWQNGYPLRRDLGDRPEEWLELCGQGLSPVIDGKTRYGFIKSIGGDNAPGAAHGTLPIPDGAGI